MRPTAVAFAIGKLLQVMAVALLAPLAIAVYDNWGGSIGELLALAEVSGFVVAITAAYASGTVLVYAYRASRHEQRAREGYAIVTIGWLVMTLVGAVPLLFWFLSQPAYGWERFFTAFTDAYFEIMSGFTTTGATILTNIEATPRSLLFLRALTHWLGGMGIITLAIVIFPTMGVSGYQMFRGEVPGVTKERLQPSLSQTVSVLWGVYVVLSAAETLLLWLGGMNLFEAVCHTFATMATGGFSTRNASVAAYESEFIEWVIIVFMYFAGINFLLHFRALRGDFRPLVRNREFLFYTAVVVVAAVVSTAVLEVDGLRPQSEASLSYRTTEWSGERFEAHYVAQGEKIGSFNDRMRASLFQTLSIVTTTGFATADFDLWPDIIRFVFILLMFFGACAGSTGGGMKMIRVMLAAKVARNELRKLTQPRLVAPVRLGDDVVDERKLTNVLAFVLLFVGLFIVTAGIMTLFVDDLTTAVTASIATIGNIGPGLAGVGAVEHYGWIPVGGKWVLVISMLLGRLEIFTVLILLRPAFWRK